jgi:hypothetical protein
MSKPRKGITTGCEEGQGHLFGVQIRAEETKAIFAGEAKRRAVLKSAEHKGARL